MSSTPEAPKRDRAYRLVVAEDAYLIREGIRSALEREEDEVEVLEYCSDLPSLLEAVEVHRPDVVITDIRMPPTNTDEGIRAAAALRASCSACTSSPASARIWASSRSGKVFFASAARIASWLALS